MHEHGGNIYKNHIKLDFSANINFLGMPEYVKEAAINGIEHSTHYPEPYGESLCLLIASRYKTDSAKVIVGNGAAELIFALVCALAPRKALIQAPTFAEYEQALCAHDCQITRHYLHREQGFKCDMDAMISRIEDDTDIVFVCNPNNPTGVVTPRQDMIRLHRACIEKDALLVVDESFLEFCPDYNELTMLERLQEGHFFIINSMTKLYAMPGLRLGYGMSSDSDIIEDMKSYMQPWSVSQPAMYAGEAIFTSTDDFVRRTVEAVARERETLAKELKTLGIEVIDGAANFLLIYDKDRDLYAHCLSRGILIRDCSNFEGLEKGWYRVCVRSHEENRQLINCLKSKA